MDLSDLQRLTLEAGGGFTITFAPRLVQDGEGPFIAGVWAHGGLGYKAIKGSDLNEMFTRALRFTESVSKPSLDGLLV